MSVGEFSAALKEQAYKQWFKSSTKNILAKPASDYRSEAQAAERTSFLLTTDTLVQVAEKLAGRELSTTETDNILADLLSLVDNKKALLVQESIQDGKKEVTAVYFRQIAFEKGIDSVLQKSLQSIKDRILIEDKGGSRPARISDFFQKGHVFGVATNVTTQTARNLAKSKVTEASKRQLLRALVNVRNKLLRQDLATANIKDLKFSLYSKYLKTPYKYLVEIQVRETNREAGGEAAVFTNALRRYFSPENNAASIAKDLNTRSSLGDKFIAKMLSGKGSPSYIDLIGLEIANVLTTGAKAKTKYFVSDTKVADISKRVDSSELRRRTKSKIAAVTKAISKVQAIYPSEETTRPLADLQALLDTSLAEQIKQNMGSGNATNVLNYQTGRLAESARVERLTESREGFVTAFYTYMRNPYATFSAGGRQQYPKSRDPKLLISKSIREIGASLAYTRMRAVNV